MTHLWVRHEPRPNERRVGVMPEGVRELLDAGLTVTVEDDPFRVVPIDDYRRTGALIAGPGAWSEAPADAVIFGLKELPDDGTPLVHRHIMFGHAYKDQEDGRRLLQRLRAGGGALYDLEYLTDEGGRRVAAFGHWAGFAGTAVSLLAWAAADDGRVCPAVGEAESPEAFVHGVRSALAGRQPSVIVIGALGRVGGGAREVCAALNLPVTEWDMAETARGGPFPEILDHDVFLNCILAGPEVPLFVPSDAADRDRRLRVIGDIACDPQSPFNPVPLYDRATTWAVPVHRVAEYPTLDIMAIDNLPSMMPREASQDFASQLLPHLCTLGDLDNGVWGRARALFERHAAAL